MNREPAFRFGEFELDASGPVLRLRGAEVAIQPKPLAMLLHLVRNRQRAVSKQELLTALWPGTTVSDQALWSALRDLRRALVDTDTGARKIRTIRGGGFQFVAGLAAIGAHGQSASPDAAPSAPSRPLATDFVDRDEATATLLAELESAARGDMRVSWIAGAAGIGKTRLAAELMAEARRRGFEARIGRCFDREGAVPFWPWIQVMRGLLAAERSTLAARQAQAVLPELAWLAPELATDLEAPEQADLDRAEVRFRFFDAFGRFLRSVGESVPLLIVVDDLHWADDASLLLFEFLTTALDGARVHLVGAFRDPPRPEQRLARVIAIAARRGACERIDLQGLRREAVSLLLQNGAERAPAPEVLEAVLRATAGNPLFVSELAKLAAQGRFDVAQLGAGLPLPQRVRDVLRWQLDRMSSDCQGVLRLLSVVGGELELAVLSDAARLPEQTVLELLAQAEVAGVALAVREQTTRFGFMHDLVRESIYRDLSIAERARLHRRIAEALEASTLTSSSADLSQIAYHYSEGAAAGAAQQAVRFGSLAGDQANARMAYEDAVAHYGRALNAMPMLDQPDPALARELLLRQAEAAWGTREDWALVQQRFVAAADAARAAGEPESLARAALGRSGRGAGPGDFRDIGSVDDVDVALLSEARDALGDAPCELLALVLARLALATRYGAGLSRADELSARAVAMAEALGRPQTLAETLRYRHEVLSGPRFAGERLVLGQRVLELARKVRSRPLELDALLFEARNRFELLDFVGSATASVAARTLSASMKHPGALFRDGIGIVFSHLLRGRFARAEASAREFLARDSARNITAQGTFEVQIVTLGMMRGDYAGIIELTVPIMARPIDLPWGDSLLANAYALSGRHADARRWFAKVAADGYRRLLDHHTCLGSYLWLAEVCVELKDKLAAEDLYQRMLPYEQMMAIPFLSTVCQGPIAHGLGLLAGFLERWDAAQVHFERALQIGETVRSPPFVALTQERFGALLLQRGRGADAQRAATLLGSAVETAARIGMKQIERRYAQWQALRSRSSDPRRLPL